MSDTLVLPDVERVLIAYLADHDAVSDLCAGRVYPHPFDKVVRPFVTVRRIGGRAAHPHWVDTPQVEIAAWGQKDASGISGYDQAQELCATALAALHDMPPIDDDGLAVVCNVADSAGPRSLPDPVTTLPRFIAEVFVTLHPYPAVS